MEALVLYCHLTRHAYNRRKRLRLADDEDLLRVRHISLDVAFEDEVRQHTFDLIHVHRVPRGYMQRQLEVLHLQLMAFLDQVTGQTHALI